MWAYELSVVHINRANQYKASEFPSTKVNVYIICLHSFSNWMNNYCSQLKSWMSTRADEE
jgi:hypothetical protein